ncbi:RDD family protein [Methylobrevis pamukkalensis]|uniref:RDD family protein n=1 Tax=Methylobrevis pamukkalensis TaxID=1439726 RepID=A0A1E3H1P1_9HYPH|nr:RDD family protein [Methylobrevis pamukkalensis]ODN69471.1 RDD family protein [Methylobrevis pamukkalensis]
MKLFRRRKPPEGKSRVRRRPAAPARRILRLLAPEGVPLDFEIASLGARFTAQVLDLLLSGVLVIALVVLLSMTLSRADMVTPIPAISALLFFAVRTPYYLVSELLWNGQTVGKRIGAMRVVSANGRGLTTHQIVVRNLMKEVEVFLPMGFLLAALGDEGGLDSALSLVWVLGTLAVPVFSRRNQRIGDLIAGTVVISLPKAVLLPDLAEVAATAVPRFVFLPHQLDHYGAYELQVLEQLLQTPASTRRGEAKRHLASLATVAERIRGRIVFEDAVRPDETRDFLAAFYVAQRAHLEKRQLFGEARADKHYAAEGSAAAGARPEGKG